MTAPNRAEVQVATAALRTEGGVWLHQSDQLEAVVHKADGLRMGRLEAGVFQVLVSAYDEVVEQVVGRCREGRARMEEIGQALRRAADVYDEEDRSGAHRFRNLY